MVIIEDISISNRVIPKEGEQDFHFLVVKVTYPVEVICHFKYFKDKTLQCTDTFVFGDVIDSIKHGIKMWFRGYGNIDPWEYKKPEQNNMNNLTIDELRKELTKAKEENKRLVTSLENIIDATEDKGGQFKAWHQNLRNTTKAGKDLLTTITKEV